MSTCCGRDGRESKPKKTSVPSIKRPQDSVLRSLRSRRDRQAGCWQRLHNTAHLLRPRILLSNELRRRKIIHLTPESLPHSSVRSGCTRPKSLLKGSGSVSRTIRSTTRLRRKDPVLAGQWRTAPKDYLVWARLATCTLRWCTLECRLSRF